MSLLFGLRLLKLGIGAVEPVPEAEPAVTCMKPVNDTLTKLIDSIILLVSNGSYLFSQFQRVQHIFHIIVFKKY